MVSPAPSVLEFEERIKALEEEVDLHVHEEENLKGLVRFETLLSELSAEFVNIPAADVGGKIQYALRRITETLEVERCTLAKITHDATRISVIQAWPGDGMIQTLGLPVNEIFPWMSRQISDGKTVSFNSTEELPPEAEKDRKAFEEFGQACMLLIPIFVNEKPAFAITLVSDDDACNWSDIHYRRLKLIGEVFANALIRKESEEKIQKTLTEIQTLRERLEAENVYLRQEISLQRRHERIIGQSKAIEGVLKKVEQVAGTDSTVLILGETGTGKGLVAWAIHDHSRRNEKSMVKVNCAALPASLIENELFGREKGAYTGAVNRQLGRFEFAHDSTIFLDEIGEIPPEIQAKLLGVLEDGRIERLGSANTIEVDVRVIAATNRDLSKFVRQGKFRQDLFFRLNVFPIFIPPPEGAARGYSPADLALHP